MLHNFSYHTITNRNIANSQLFASCDVISYHTMHRVITMIGYVVLLIYRGTISN